MSLYILSIIHYHAYFIVFSLLSIFFFFQEEEGIRDWSVTGVQTCFFFFQAEDGIRDWSVTGVQTCALPISSRRRHTRLVSDWSSDVCSSDLQSELQSLTNLVCRLLLGVQTVDRKSTRLNSSH